MSRRFPIVVFLAFAMAGRVLAQPPSPVVAMSPVRDVLRAAIDSGTIPGAVAHVSQHGKLLLFEATGKAGAGREMTTDALFAIASMTKPITSVGVMILVEDGRLRLDDPVSRYLPEFDGLRVLDKESGALTRPKRSVTVRDLLTQTSGIAYGLNPPESLKPNFETARLADGLGPENPTLERNIQRLAQIPLAHEPGAAWTYGMNTDALGRVIEVASGVSFDRFLADRIFGPLKMTDTAFRVAPAKARRLVSLFSPGSKGSVEELDADPKSLGGVTVSPKRVLGELKYLSGGAGLVSTAADYARFLQMLLNEGTLEGQRLLRAETVRAMTRNQIGPLDCAFSIHGDKFGFGFGVTTKPGGPASVGSYSWGGMYHTFFWVDPKRELVAIVMTQLYPWGKSTLWADFQRAVYQSIGPEQAPAPLPSPSPVPSASFSPRGGGGRYLREFWFEPGVGHGNPVTNGRFRVNDPLAALHPEFGKRSETLGNGMLQILLDEPIENIQGAELALELWGGHPGTARKRVSVNGRGSYAIPEVGSAAGHCAHQYPILSLERSDLVRAHNAFQFSCDRGDAFWGHFIVESAALRVEIGPGNPALVAAKIDGATASLKTTRKGDVIEVALQAPRGFLEQVAGVDFQGFYDGYDENGDGHSRDWHGMVKRRSPYGHLGSVEASPFSMRWETSGLPSQEGMAVRAVVRFKGHPDLIHETPSVGGLGIPSDRPFEIRRFRPEALPRPFWSRDHQKQACILPCDLGPDAIESAEIRLVVWDGGVEKVEAPLTLNGRPLGFRSDGKHDVKSLRLPIDPSWLRAAQNTFEVLSDTKHHGIEVLLPGPELWVKTRTSLKGARRDLADELRRAAMNRGGDPSKGKDLFTSARLNCATCHRVHGQGGQTGPDLSVVAGKFDRTHLIESLLEPSAQILEGYRTTLVGLADGRSLSGIVVEASPAGFTLHDAEGKTQKVSASDVEQLTTSPVSLMPEGLSEILSPVEFTDLVAYLETLRTGGKLSPGEGETGALAMPPGFSAEVVASGITGATAMEVAPDGRVFVCEQSGALRVFQEGKWLAEPFVRLPVASSWERGLIGVTVAPDFPQVPYVYVCQVVERPYPHHVVSRFTLEGDRAAPGSELILFEGDDQSKLGGQKIDGHQGGALHFGIDGNLYVGIGEQTAGAPSQSMASLLGKILRINPDGSIPTDNPFASEAEGKYRAIWALGCRNPFGFAVQRGTGRIFINDVGGKAEEINEGKAGANYGWPTVDHGPTDDPRFLGPIHHYPTACVTGGAFSDSASPWPVDYRGKYFFADFNHGFIKTIDPDAPAASRGFASGLHRPVDLRFAPNGDLYILQRDAWVIDGHFRPGTGQLLRVRYRPAESPQPVAN